MTHNELIASLGKIHLLHIERMNAREIIEHDDCDPQSDAFGNADKLDNALLETIPRMDCETEFDAHGHIRAAADILIFMIEADGFEGAELRDMRERVLASLGKAHRFLQAAWADA